LQRDDSRAFVDRGCDERGIGRSQRLVDGQGRRKGDAISHRQRAAVSMVMARMEPTGAQPDGLVHIEDHEPTEREPAELLLDVSGRPALVTNKNVEHLREVDGADAGRIGQIAEKCLDLGCCRFAGQRGDNRLRIDDAQRRAARRASIADSSSRVDERSSSPLGSRPDRDPMAAPIGSAGIGRIRTAVP
jgi:hypothetical protein